MKKYLLHILLFTVTAGVAQERPKVSVKVDTSKIRIGEQIDYQITVKDAETAVIFTELRLDSLGKIEVVETFDIDTLKDKLVKKYTLTSFDSGRYYIPKQSIFIWNQPYFTDSIWVDVATVAVDTTKQKMYPIKAIQNEPYTLDDFKSYLWWILGILLVIALILYFIFRKKETLEEIEARIPPYELAMKRLKELDEKRLLEKNKIKRYYVELTGIVRTYIERDMKIPALESTTNELLDTLHDFNNSSALNIQDGTLNKLQKLLKGADLVKFAKYTPLSNDIELDRNNAAEVIEEIKSTKPEIVVNKPKCPITNEEATDVVTLYKWSYYIIYFGLKRKKVPVSAAVKEIHLRKQSYFWKIINSGGTVIMRIPFIGGTLLIIWLVIIGYFLIAVAVIELLFTGRFLSRGLISLKENGSIKISSINKNALNDRLEKVKAEPDISRKTKFRKNITRILIAASILIPIIFLAYIFLYTGRETTSPTEETAAVRRYNDNGRKEMASPHMNLKEFEDGTVG